MYTRRWNINRGYMKLDVWKSAQDLVKVVEEILSRSRLKDFKTTSQIRDAVHSAAANIPEGYCRRSIKEYMQHCYISLGSLAELMSRMVSLKVTAFIDDTDFDRFDAKHFETENKLIALVKSLEAKEKNGTWVSQLHEDRPYYSITPKSKSR